MCLQKEMHDELHSTNIRVLPSVVQNACPTCEHQVSHTVKGLCKAEVCAYHMFLCTRNEWFSMLNTSLAAVYGNALPIQYCNILRQSWLSSHCIQLHRAVVY